jgi:aryl-alcohol dehydrogenase-like predicted oxidoreductase
MQRIALAEDLEPSCYCLGTADFGAKVDAPQTDRLINCFRDAGGNFLDTAHCYAFWGPCGDGSSERALAGYFRRNGGRREMIVATKGGHPSVHTYRRPERPHLAPERIEADLCESRERLEQDRIDLYWLHRDEPDRDVEEIIDCLNDFIARGWIAHIGASNWSVQRIEAANQYARDCGKQGFIASQPHWNLAWVDPGKKNATDFFRPGDAAWHEKSRLPVVCYSSTAQGFFATGAPGKRYDNPRSFERLARARALAQNLGLKPTQVALAWLGSHRFPVIPILGSTRVDHLSSALEARDLRLSDAQRNWLAEG